MDCYKLLSEDMESYNGTSWRRNVGQPAAICRGSVRGPGWWHAYSDAFLAVMLTPIHNNFTTPTLFKAVGSGKHGNDRGLTLGFERLRIQDELPLPSVSPLQRVTMAILCAKQVCTYPAWCEWADAWIKGDFDSRRAILVLQRCHISVGANIAQGKNWIGESDGVVAGRAACRAAIWTRERTLWVSETKFEAAVAVARAATVLNPDIGPQQLARKPNLRNRMLDLPALMKRAMEIGDAEHI